MKNFIALVALAISICFASIGEAYAEPKASKPTTHAAVSKAKEKQLAEAKKVVVRRAAPVAAVIAVALTAAPSVTKKSKEQPDEIESATVNVRYIAKTYQNVTEDDAWMIVALAAKYADPVFPTAKDILGVMEIESGFNPRAKLGPCLGLMQIDRNHHRKRILGGTLYNPETNIRAGATYLRELYGSLKSRRAAIMAYNLGEGAYRSGHRNAKYFKLVDRSTRNFVH
jgi:soluble lytic murein transglycosylase-like protein